MERTRSDGMGLDGRGFEGFACLVAFGLLISATWGWPQACLAMLLRALGVP